ncbi:hypothetical protein KQX54_003573 [Cotesia glomerata]|uniref:EGF-like domain-containing protein n=1 Tax=Cotesia glomerata TaxID=32391 RepID=A0AAV7I6V0_COTGL|nr:hypothetical protein KQX54_003573 [Cotesia glomerata]
MMNIFKGTKSLNLNTSCEYNSDCFAVDYTICAKGRCKCVPNYIQINSYTCASFLGAFCENNKTCIASNSACIDNKCQCKPLFVSKTNRECVPIPLRRSCTKDFDCIDVENAKCSDNYKCICKDNYAERNHATCQPLLGEFCKKDTDCEVDNSICKDSKCQCKDKFAPESNNNKKCTSNPLGKFCEINEDCSNILHAKCSKSKICVCRDQYDEINNSTCEPPLGEFCWNNERCAAINSICNYNECQCKPGYVPLSKNECIKSPVGSDCWDDSDCTKKLRQTKCSKNKKCICEEEIVSENGFECLQVLDDFCYNDNQCGPKLSICMNQKFFDRY